jgi:hypothetical protein
VRTQAIVARLPSVLPYLHGKDLPCCFLVCGTKRIQPVSFLYVAQRESSPALLLSHMWVINNF